MTHPVDPPISVSRKDAALVGLPVPVARTAVEVLDASGEFERLATSSPSALSTPFGGMTMFDMRHKDSGRVYRFVLQEHR
jgi:hypothetical protein